MTFDEAMHALEMLCADPALPDSLRPSVFSISEAITLATNYRPPYTSLCSVGPSIMRDDAIAVRLSINIALFEEMHNLDEQALADYLRATSYRALEQTDWSLGCSEARRKLSALHEKTMDRLFRGGPER